MRSIIIFFICFSFTLHAQEKQGRVMRPNTKGIGKCLVTVSYTHLDVYKRQYQG